MSENQVKFEMNAGDELLRLLRAVKAHDPRGADEENDADQDVYAHAFDDDAVLLCLNALQAATEAETWQITPLLTELVRELLDWDISVLQLKRSTKSSLMTVRWAFIARAVLLGSIPATDYEPIVAKLRARLQSDRFSPVEIQYAAADCLISVIRIGQWSCDDWTLDILKQFYVTLPRFDVRKHIGEVVVALTVSKDDVKASVHVGLYRAIVQVCLDWARNQDASKVGVANDDREPSTLTDLVRPAVSVLRQAAAVVCVNKPDHFGPGPVICLCEAVVHLLLSRVVIVCEEAIRMLQMLVESPPFLHVLPSLVDLRGAIEKARILASLPEGRPTINDPYVRSVCEQLHALLIPQIDDYEKRHGSLVGLMDFMDIDSCSTFEQSMNSALKCKSRGNSFYQYGNFPTARLFYRRAMAIIKAAEFQAERRLASLSPEEVQKRCSIGASVHVLQSDGCWRGAIVSDVDDSMIEVLYDDKDEEENQVRLHRIRLRLDTSQLAQFRTVEVDCAMNMGKAFTMLHDQLHAIECYTHVLSIQPQYAAAWYHRGVARLVLHELKLAQQDLWRANELCGKWRTHDPVETKKKKILHDQIVAAYKKLQALHTSKKKVEKRVIKQMLRYVSTIPGLHSEIM